MRRTLAVLALAGCFWATPATAQTTIGFDDIINYVGIGQIPNGYAGFNWTNFWVIHRDHHPGSGYDNGIVSGDYAAFNSFADDALIVDAGGARFNVFSAYLTAAWNNDLNLVITGFRAGVQVFYQALVLQATGPLYAMLNFFDIDQIRFSSFGGTNAGLGDGGTHFVMDDLVVGMVDVPEPVTLLLLVPGLLGVGVAVRRRRRGDLDLLA